MEEPSATCESLILSSPKLGPIPYGPEDVVRFEEGLPGFEGLREFLIVTRDECAPFVFLASVTDTAVALPLLPLALAAGEDAPSLTGEALAALGDRVPGAGPASSIAAYVVVAIGPEAREILANLRAPVVVDLDSRHGAQVVLADDRLPVAAPLIA
jgi:flagellar assembly factor FliW